MVYIAMYNERDMLFHSPFTKNVRNRKFFREFIVANSKIRNFACGCECEKFAKYEKNSHLFAKLYIFVYNWVIISQINANFMRIFIIRIRMRMRNFVSMHISQSSKKCYEISHILGKYCTYYFNGIIDTPIKEHK